MPLTLRMFSEVSPESFGSKPTPKHWAVYSGKFNAGSIQQIVGGPKHDGWWRWQITTVLMGYAPIERGGTEPTKDAALTAFDKSWRAWLAYAELHELTTA